MDRHELLDHMFSVLYFLLRDQHAKGIEEVSSVIKVFRICNRLIGKHISPAWFIKTNDVLKMTIDFLKERLDPDHFYLFKCHCLNNKGLIASCAESPYFSYGLYYRDYLTNTGCNIGSFHRKILKKITDRCQQGKLFLDDLIIINNEIYDSYSPNRKEICLLERNYVSMSEKLAHLSFCEYCGHSLNFLFSEGKIYKMAHYCSAYGCF